MNYLYQILGLEQSRFMIESVEIAQFLLIVRTQIVSLAGFIEKGRG